MDGWMDDPAPAPAPESSLTVKSELPSFSVSRSTVPLDRDNHSMLDRTAEFRSCVAIANKTSKQREKAKEQTKPAKKASEFYSAASAISHEINTTSEKLQRLAQLCQKKSIFDDHTTKIQELTYIIKQDLAHITEEVGALQSSSSKATGKGNQAIHVDSVVGSLKKGVDSTTRSFKDILEVRTKNMRESKMRTDNFVHAGHLQHMTHLQNNPLYAHRASSAPPTSPTKTDDGRFEYLSLDDVTSNQADNPYVVTQQQSQALMTQDASDQYLESRSTAIETIESTIAELGGIFQQLAQMVSEQRESVQRIDANTEDVEMNIERANFEIMKYWKRVSGNRMLMVKIFGILILFFLLFVMLR